ncbi:MAG: acyltransferase domain-containing protein, partial [Acidobacteriota bacterium]|nr:acyltransferase domain-containing protein [Acidobacteriota bacterium]
AHGYRFAAACRDTADAIAILSGSDANRAAVSLREPTARQVIFLFPGQGTQYPEAGRELYETEPVFREALDRCAGLLREPLGFDLRHVLYGTPESADARAEKLKQTALTQPVLFALEYALAMLWNSWGFQPQAMIGHSIGEYVAACLSGVMSLEDAISLVAERGRLIGSLPPGAMLAIPLPETQVRNLIAEGVSIAAVNAASLTVVSGETGDIEALERKLAARGIECRRLHTSHAFHSSMMDAILEPFTARVRQAKLQTPKIPFISNVTGAWITRSQAVDPAYWASHLRGPVRFDDGIAELLRQPDRVLLEMGPGHTLTSLSRSRIDKAQGQSATPSLRGPHELGSDRQTMLMALARLWTAGIKINWSKVDGAGPRRRIALPTYPFERQKYWVEPSIELTAAAPAASVSKNADEANWFYVPSWKRSAPLSMLAATAPPRHSPWLVFADQIGLAAHLMARLRERGETVIEVVSGQQYAKSGNDRFVIDPQQPQDYVRLLQQLAMQGRVPRRVAHLWSVTGTGQEPGPLSPASQYEGLYSTLFLSHALNYVGQDAVQVFAISNNIQDVDGREPVVASKATNLAACIVVPQEHPAIHIRSIDVPALPERPESLALDLLREFEGPGAEPFVAYRNGYRWVQTFEPVRLEQPPSTPGRLRQNGVYVITGGLGNIGLAIALYLAQTVQASVVLTGRTAFPPREQWDAWPAANGLNDVTAQRIERLRQIEQSGGQILVLNADSRDESQMQTVFATAEQRFGSVAGVFHALGRGIRRDSFAQRAAVRNTFRSQG